MLVGAGAVGESILKVMQWRDPKGEWLKYVLVCDYDLKRAEEVVGMMKGDSRFEASKIDATNTEKMAELIREHKIDFVMDAAPPFASNMIFDAAFKTGADYGSMGTWSVPMEDPAYGLGIENSYTEPMTKYNFDRHEAWKKQGNMAVICMGIDPGVVNVFAKYAATELLDEITEVHVKDGGNLSVPGADPDDIMFGFNVWTVLDEVMNPNVEYDKDKGGFIVEKAFAGQEVYEMPEGVGKNTLVKVEHEEVVTMARYLSQYGLKKATFKISLDENLITALKVLDKLGLRSIKPVQVGDVKVVPRDVVAACAPQPKDIGDEMTGKMVVGVQCIGKKDGKEKEYFLTIPCGIILTEKVIITVCLEDTAVLADFKNGRVRNFWTFKRTRFILQILYRNASLYLQYLRIIDKKSDSVEKQLHISTKNQELIELLELEKSLVYFSTSLRSNELVLEKMLKIDKIKQYPEDEELLDDVIIENKQAIEMADIYSNILSGTMDAYASVISNNLNIVMKVLAIITIVMSIPTMIASFWGMNVPVPLAHSAHGFLILVIVSLILTIFGGYILGKKNMF